MAVAVRVIGLGSRQRRRPRQRGRDGGRPERLAGEQGRRSGRDFMALTRRTAWSVALAAVAGLAIGSAAMSASAETVLKRGIGATIGTLDPQVNFLIYEGWIQDDM